jgi:hypothetical protein
MVNINRFYLYLELLNLFFAVMISVLYVICLASLNTGTPLLFELGCEMSHPVSEEMVAGSFDQVGFHLAQLILGFILLQLQRILVLTWFKAFEKLS